METLAGLLSDNLLEPLVNPVVIALAAVLTLALISGFVAHAAEFLEDLLPSETREPEAVENRESSSIDN